METTLTQLVAFFRRVQNDPAMPRDLREYARLFLTSDKDFRDNYLMLSAFKVRSDHIHLVRR